MLMPDELTGGAGGGDVNDGGTPASAPVSAPEPTGLDTDKASEQIGKDLFEQPARDRNFNRDEKGKFAPKSVNVPAPASTQAKPEGVVTPGTDNTVTQTQAQAQVQTTPGSEPAPGDNLQTLQAPATWTKDAREFWAQIPPRAQAEIMKRESDMHKGIAQYREAAAVGQTFAETLRPFVPALQKFNLNPSDLLRRALNAHLNLTLAPADVKLKLFRGLAQDYGIELETLMDDLPYEAPETVALKQEIGTLRQTLEGMQQRQQEARRQETQASVDAFAADPENIYFDELADDIAQLITSGVAPDLKTAYEKALWLNPAVRDKELARQAAARQAKAAQDEAKRLEDAKKASAANVHTQVHPAVAQESAATGDMDATLKEAMDKIKKRG